MLSKITNSTQEALKKAYLDASLVVTAQMKTSEKGSFQTAIGSALQRKSIDRSDAEQVVKVSLRVAFAALGAFTIHMAGGSASVAAVLGATISLPAMVIAVGGYLAYTGSSAVISSLATGSFASLGYGSVLGLAGWFVLSHHNIFPLGIAEPKFQALAESSAPALLKKLG